MDNYHNYKINREYFHEKVIIMIRRLEQFIKNQGLSVRSFEQSIGASDGMIRRAIKNNTDIQSKWLSITADIYPNLDINWLLTGRGFMLKSESTSPTGEHVSDPLPLPTEESLLYTMYKEEKAENKELIEQIGALKQQIKTLEEKIAELQLSPLPNVASVGSTRIRKSDVVDLGDVQFVGQ